MLSALSHTMRASELCLIWVSWAGVKTPGFSYHSLSPSRRRLNCVLSRHIKVGPRRLPGTRSSTMRAGNRSMLSGEPYSRCSFSRISGLLISFFRPSKVWAADRLQ